MCAVCSVYLAFCSVLCSSCIVFCEVWCLYCVLWSVSLVRCFVKCEVLTVTLVECRLFTKCSVGAGEYLEARQTKKCTFWLCHAVDLIQWASLCGVNGLTWPNICFSNITEHSRTSELQHCTQTQYIKLYNLMHCVAPHCIVLGCIYFIPLDRTDLI